jgi:sugar lactone lactonase YvrE
VKRLIVAGAACSAALVTAGAVAGAPEATQARTKPTRIDLPNGYQPEGIAAGRRRTLYVGSIPTGEVRQVDPRTGTTRVVVPGRPDVAAAIGLKARRHRLFVAGGPTGKAFIYSADTGAERVSLQLNPSEDTFINDVTVRGRFAYFTDSRKSSIFAVRRNGSGFREIATPDIPLLEGNNLNGIAATKKRRFVLAIQGGTAGVLWRINVVTGAARRVDLGGVVLTNGDGLLRQGRRLYVVQNRLNQIAVIAMARNYASGVLRNVLTAAPGLLDVPTTVARLGNSLYLPNARFGVAEPESAEYWITRIRLRR